MLNFFHSKRIILHVTHAKGDVSYLAQCRTGKRNAMYEPELSKLTDLFNKQVLRDDERS